TLKKRWMTSRSRRFVSVEISYVIAPPCLAFDLNESGPTVAEHDRGQATREEHAGVDVDAIALQLGLAGDVGRVTVYDDEAVIAFVVQELLPDPDQRPLRLILERPFRNYPGMNEEVFLPLRLDHLGQRQLVHPIDVLRELVVKAVVACEGLLLTHIGNEL